MQRGFMILMSMGFFMLISSMRTTGDATSKPDIVEQSLVQSEAISASDPIIMSPSSPQDAHEDHRIEAAIKEVAEVDTGPAAHETNVVAAETHRKHLCIGMAKDLLEEQLAVFAASFREHVPDDYADIVIFINENIEGRMKELVDKYSVTAIFFNQSDLQPPAMQKYHPSTYRSVSWKGRCSFGQL